MPVCLPVVEETIDLEAQNIEMTQSLTKFDYTNEMMPTGHAHEENISLLNHSISCNIEFENASRLIQEELQYSKPLQTFEPYRLEREGPIR
jgi:hypothetical protein